MYLRAFSSADNGQFLMSTFYHGENEEHRDLIEIIKKVIDAGERNIKNTCEILAGK
jgi:hypothetical protein